MSLVGNSRRVDVSAAEEALFRLYYLVEQHAGTIKGNLFGPHIRCAVGKAIFG